MQVNIKSDWQIEKQQQPNMDIDNQVQPLGGLNF